MGASLLLCEFVRKPGPGTEYFVVDISNSRYQSLKPVSRKNCSD